MNEQLRESPWPRSGLTVVVLALAAVATLGSLLGGPALGEHEALVAECARHMVVSGDWLVPEFMEMPFIRKPPLPYWLIAAASYLFPSDAATGQPVTAVVARLPSALSGFLTVLLVWRLGSCMFGRRGGLIAAVLASSSAAFLLYSANATPEMMLTCCCTWAYLHFWYAVQARSGKARFAHMMLFYVALGMAMLAKGPAPIAVTAMPLALWWYTARPLRILSRRRFDGWRLVLACFVRDLIPRTVKIFTQLWVLPGLILFGLFFVPWMLAVAERYEHAWNLWNWQYWQRARGHFEDTRSRGWFYYPPVLAALLLPWLFMVFEGLAAPWLKMYARRHKALLYVGLCALMSAVVMSIMTFKKPYYVLPAVPGLILLMVPVAERFYLWSSYLVSPAAREKGRWGVPVRLAWTVWGVLAVVLIGGLIGGGVWAKMTEPAVLVVGLIAGAIGVGFMLAGGVAYIRGRGWHALGLTAAGVVLAFHGVWHFGGPVLEDAEKAGVLARALDDAGVPADAEVIWVDGRPDSRLSFYFGRHSRQMLMPSEIVTKMVNRTGKRSKTALAEMVLEMADDHLGRDTPVYMVLEQRHHDLWWEYISNPSQLVAAVDSDPDTNTKDWVVVTNPAGAQELGRAE